MYPRKSLILTAGAIVLSSLLFGRVEGSPSKSSQVLRSSAGLPDDSSNKGIEFVGSFGGPVTAVAVESTLAYTGEGTRLTVMDVTDPNQPEPLSSPELHGPVGDILVDGTHVHMANQDRGLQIVDVSDASNPVLAGAYPIPGKPESLYLDGSRIYLAAGQAGLFILDVTDPANPALLGQYAVPVFDVWVQGTNAYIVDGDFKFLNVTDPAAPSLITTYPTPGQAGAVQIVGARAFIADGSTFLILDITDPLNPAPVGSYENDWPIHDVDIQGGSAYLVYTVNRLPWIDPTWSCGLRLIDVSGPGNPSLLGEYLRDTYSPEACEGNLRVLADRAYLANGDLQIIDVADPALPELLGTYLSVHPDAIWLAGNFAYLADQERGLLIFDLSDPLHPELRGIYEHAGILDVQVVGSTAFAASREPSTAHFPSGDLLVIDVSDASNPVLASTYIALALDMEIEDGWAYLVRNVAGFSPVLTILDLRDPYNPVPYLDGCRVVPSSSNTPGLKLVAAAGRFVYVTDSSMTPETFYILDASAPWSPIIRGSLPLGGNFFSGVSQVRVISNYAYTASGDSGMQILDLSDADHPEIVGAYDTPGETQDLQIIADTAYLADGSGGVQIVEVSDRSNPTVLADYAPIFAQAIGVDGDMIYTIDGAGGVSMLRYVSSASASISPAGGDLVSADDSTLYHFSAGTFSVPVSVTHTTRSITNLPATGDLKDIGHNFELSTVDAANGLPVQPGQPYAITIGYTDEERVPVIENTLALFSWDGEQWIQEPTSVVHRGAHTITATPDHFSLWAVLGDTHRFFAPLISVGDEALFYRVYGSEAGWMNWVPGVDTAGNVGKDQRLEAIQIRLSNPPPGMRVEYQVHLENIGWMDWVAGGEIAGLPGGNLRLEAIRIELTNAPPGYSVAYQANVEGLGWMDGVFDGQTAGTTGESRRLEAIRIQVIIP